MRHSGRGTTKAKVAIGLATTDAKPLYVKMQVLPALTAVDLSGFVLDNVDPEACVVTDSFQGYHGLSDIVGKHEMKVYAKEPAEFLKWIHTIVSNAKPSSWALIMAWTKSIFRRILTSFATDSIGAPSGERSSAACVDGPPLTYAELVA